jgi:hypothetical protein
MSVLTAAVPGTILTIGEPERLSFVVQRPRSSTPLPSVPDLPRPLYGNCFGKALEKHHSSCPFLAMASTSLVNFPRIWLDSVKHTQFLSEEIGSQMQPKHVCS